MMHKFKTAGTLIECKGKILILHRKPTRLISETWGLPAGKISENEKDIDAAVREIFEETGLNINAEKLEFIGDFGGIYGDFDVKFLTFRLKINDFFDVKLNLEEHSEYKWITPEECYEIKNLIHGFHNLLEKIYGIKK